MRAYVEMGNTTGETMDIKQCICSKIQKNMGITTETKDYVETMSNSIDQVSVVVCDISQSLQENNKDSFKMNAKAQEMEEKLDLLIEQTESLGLREILKDLKKDVSAIVETAQDVGIRSKESSEGARKIVNVVCDLVYQSQEVINRMDEVGESNEEIKEWMGSFDV